uniref:Uncharacterized protein n=1 Tax=Helianthus annuus TaxID=4232 RepID=A0A251VEY3_HELAN
MNRHVLLECGSSPNNEIGLLSYQTKISNHNYLPSRKQLGSWALVLFREVNFKFRCHPLLLVCN